MAAGDDLFSSLTPATVAEIAGLKSARDLRRFLSTHREVNGEALWRSMHQSPGSVQSVPPESLVAMISLIRDAQAGDAGLAWRKFREYQNQFAQNQSQAMAMLDQIGQKLEQREFDEVLRVAGQARQSLEEQGQIGPLMMLLSFDGQAAFQTRSGNRAQNLERAGASLHEALRIAHFLDDQAVVNDLTNKLATVLAERIRGDAIDDLTAAEDLMRNAIATLPDHETNLIAMRRTNLATILLRRYDRDRNEARVEEAIRLCREALTDRPLLEDPEGWAYTQLTLGDALHTLSSLNRADLLDEAVNAFDSISIERDRIPDAILVAEALMRLGVIASATQGSEGLDPPTILREADAFGLLRDALSLAGDNRLLSGRIFLECGTAYARLNLHDQAAAAMMQSLDFLEPTNSPANCARATGFLGNYFADRGKWRECARYSLIAVEVAELTVHSQLDRGTRVAEMKRAGNTYRWAAFALACSGEFAQAAVVLEQGRAREIRARLPTASVESSLDEIPASLREQYDLALSSLRKSPLGDRGGPALRLLMEATAAIRSLQGFENFGMTLRSEDVAKGAEPGWPLVFVNPSPWGTLLLAVSRNESGAQFEAQILGEVKSGDVAGMLLVGVTDPDEYDGSSDVYSYILSIGSPDVNESLFRPTLDRTLQWVGESICRHFRKLPSLATADGMTLIVSGLLGMVPLHAAPWVESNVAVDLISFIPVRYSASALTCADALQRLRKWKGATPRLVALANPTGDLPASEAEVESIASAFGSDASIVALRGEATSSFLLTEGPSASHLHLGCHARASTFDDVAAVVDLADGPWAMGLTSQAFNLQARLTVMSACQTGIWTLNEVGDEMLSMASAVHTLGSVCVVATLWQVNSYATAILVSRFYDRFLQGVTPAEALREAQIWLRDLDGSALIEFMREHPLLTDGLSRRGMSGPAPAGSSTGDLAHPFAHPDYWAAFIALGV